METTNIKKFITCFNCGKNVTQAKRWYHCDQDDLVCLDCAKTLTHSDTAYAGISVDKMQIEEVI